MSTANDDGENPYCVERTVCELEFHHICMLISLKKVQNIIQWFAMSVDQRDGLHAMFALCFISNIRQRK